MTGHVIIRGAYLPARPLHDPNQKTLDRRDFRFHRRRWLRHTAVFARSRARHRYAQPFRSATRPSVMGYMRVLGARHDIAAGDAVVWEYSLLDTLLTKSLFDANDVHNARRLAWQCLIERDANIIVLLVRRKSTCIDAAPARTIASRCRHDRRALHRHARTVQGTRYPRPYPAHYRERPHPRPILHWSMRWSTPFLRTCRHRNAPRTTPPSNGCAQKPHGTGTGSMHGTCCGRRHVRTPIPQFTACDRCGALADRCRRRLRHYDALSASAASVRTNPADCGAVTRAALRPRCACQPGCLIRFCCARPRSRACAARSHASAVRRTMRMGAESWCRLRAGVEQGTGRSECFWDPLRSRTRRANTIPAKSSQPPAWGTWSAIPTIDRLTRRPLLRQRQRHLVAQVHGQRLFGHGLYRSRIIECLAK